MGVQGIEEDTAAVPRGSYVLNENHELVLGLGFKGLSWEEARLVQVPAHAAWEGPRLRPRLRARRHRVPQLLPRLARPRPAQRLLGDADGPRFVVCAAPVAAVARLRGLPHPQLAPLRRHVL